MGKIIAGINMTLDGVCDHTKGLPDDEIHFHYDQLLRSADAVLYGRITYQLMEFWRTIVEKPTGNKSMDEFATAMDNIPKIVFSHTLTGVDWKSATLAKRGLVEEVLALTQQQDKNILIGSRSLIIALLKLGLIDEFQLMIYPAVAGEGMALFENVHDMTMLKLLKTKTFSSGAVLLYYEPAAKWAGERS